MNIIKIDIDEIRVYNKTDGSVKVITTTNEIETIFKLVKNKGENTVGILLPTNASVKLIHDCLKSKGIIDIEQKYSSGSTWEDTVNFNNGSTKVMTFWSCKGIQFDYVVIPFLDKEHGNEYQYNGKSNETRAIYVAMTRTKKALYFTKPNEYSFPYDKDLDDRYIDEQVMEEKKEVNFDDLFKTS